MYERLQNVYRHGYSNVLNPNPNVKRWYWHANPSRPDWRLSED
jgi:hypothetical protein